jgi:thymidylate synthase
LEYVLANGERVAPRMLPTIEVRSAHLILENPRHRFLQVSGRTINPAFAVAEAVWILSGSDDSWIFTYNEKLRQYTDHGVLKGAYGPRIRHWSGFIDQLDTVRKLLLQQPYTRQATMQLFDPARDYSGHRDVPCTLNHHFLIRNGYLDMYATMRSQDVWLGMPYDVFTNTIIQEILAGWVGVEIGVYHHRVDSLHLYDHNLDFARQVKLLDSNSEMCLADLQIGWDDFDSTLQSIVDDRSVAHPGWEDFRLVMHSYKLWKMGDIEKAKEALLQLSSPLDTSLSNWYSNRILKLK